MFGVRRFGSVVTGTANKNVFVTELESSKTQADQAVQQAIAKIENVLKTATLDLKAAGQQVSLDLDQIVGQLNAAKKDWLDHVGDPFEKAILSLKANLTPLN